MTDVDQAKRDLGARLSELRKDAGLSGRAFALLAGWGPSKVSRFERGIRWPSEADLRVWCRVTNAGDALADLVATVRNIETAYVEWKRILAAGFQRRQQQAVDVEATTRLIRGFDPDMIPGLLQIRSYAAAIITTARILYGGTDDIEAAVDTRLRRQRVLHKGDHRFAFLLGEQALHTTADNDAVMCEQLQHLLDVMRLPKLSIGVIPRDAAYVGAHNFVIHDQSTVLVEIISAELTVTRPSEIALYERMFQMLTKQAVVGNGARALITAALEQRRATNDDS